MALLPIFNSLLIAIAIKILLMLIRLVLIFYRKEFN